MLRSSNSVTSGASRASSAAAQAESPFYDHDGRKSDSVVRSASSACPCPVLKSEKYSRLDKDCCTAAAVWWNFGLSRLAKIVIGVAAVVGTLFVMYSTRVVLVGMNAEIEKLSVKLESAQSEANKYKSVLSSERNRFSREKEGFDNISKTQREKLDELKARLSSLVEEQEKLDGEHRLSMGREKQKAVDLTRQLKDAAAEYELRVQENTKKRIKLQKEVKELQIRLAEADAERASYDSNGQVHGSYYLQACEDKLSQTEYAVKKVQAQLSEVRELRGEPGLELMGVFSLLAREEEVLGELMVTAALTTQRDSVTPAKMHLKFVDKVRSKLTGSAKAQYWHQAVEACMTLGHQADKFVVFLEPDVYLMEGWLRQILNCFNSDSGGLTSVCCMPLGNGEKYCDTGLFAVKCNSHVTGMMTGIRQRLENAPAYDLDRNSYAGLNWGLLQLGWDQVKFLPLWEFRNQLGNSLVTTYDLRTLGKAYRASGPLGTDEEAFLKVRRLLRMRANTWEEKTQSNELDVRKSLHVSWSSIMGTCVFTLVDPRREPHFAEELETDEAREERGRQVHKCQSIVPAPGPPSYSEQLVKYLDIWVSTRYYSDKIPRNHPMAVPPVWGKAMPLRDLAKSQGKTPKDTLSKAELAHNEVLASVGGTPHDAEPISNDKEGFDRFVLSPMQLFHTGTQIDPWLAFSLFEAMDEDVRAHGGLALSHEELSHLVEQELPPGGVIGGNDLLALEQEV